MTHHINITQHRDQALAENHSDRNVHDSLKHLSVEELQAVSLQDRLPWYTCLINITGDLNVGTIIRTSHCLGAAGVIVFGRRKFDKRGLVGSANYIHVDRVSAMDEELNLDENMFEDYMRQHNLFPVFVETGGTPLPQVNWKSTIGNILSWGWKPCLVMGNETGGIPDNILYSPMGHNRGLIISVPQRGVIRSLNVSTAHALVSGQMCAAMGWMG